MPEPNVVDCLFVYCEEYREVLIYIITPYSEFVSTLSGTSEDIPPCRVLSTEQVIKYSLGSL